ncbi:MAG: S-layer homology domain-containing protein [Caldicoprobacterales bacterium]
MKDTNNILKTALRIFFIVFVAGAVTLNLISYTFSLTATDSPNVLITINSDGSVSQSGNLFDGLLYPSTVTDAEKGIGGINGIIRIQNQFKKIDVENLAIGIKNMVIENDYPKEIVFNSFLQHVKLKIEKGVLLSFNKILIDYISLENILYEQDSNEYRGYTLDEKDRFSINKGDSIDLKYSLHMDVKAGNELQSVTAYIPIYINLIGVETDDNDDDDDEKIIKDKEVPVAVLEKADHFAYIIGYPEGDIRPLNQITREEVAMIFYRLLTDDSRNQLLSDDNPFTDIGGYRWSNRAISTLYVGGVISGYPDGTFRPSAPITRAEFATIASKFDKLELTNASKFTDIFGHWAEKYITSSEIKGWIKGYPDLTFKPEQYITRAEAVTLINNVLNRAVPAENIHPDAIFWPDNPSTEWYYEAVMEATNSHDYIYEEDGDELWTGIKGNKVWP